MTRSKLRLLIIDDDEINNFLLVRLIKERKLPASAQAVTDGKKGLRKLERLDEEGSRQYPDIILLDVDMPELNGFEFLAKYEESLAARHPETQIYLVHHTIKPEDRLTAKTYESVSNFVCKPFSAVAIEEIIHQYSLTKQR